MNRRQFLLTSVAGATASAQRNRPVVQRPNILVIMADDLGAWMLGCYGNKEFRTPNIDNIARGGLRFTNAFCTSPASSPSRATFFTGRTPSQHGLSDSLELNGAAAPASFASEVMISDLLANAGYACGYVGKWAMGNTGQPGHGWKYTYVLAGPLASYEDPEMIFNGKAVKEHGYAPDLLTNRACEFLDGQSPAAPFFLTIAYPNPRPPYVGQPAKFEEMYAGAQFDTIGWERPAANAASGQDLLANIVPSLRQAAASITALDAQALRLVRKLQDRKLWDNTMIIVTSDTGSLLGRHGLWGDGHASNPPNMYDEVVKAPFILSWPGKVPTAEIAPETIGLYDVLPTLCEAAGVAPPTNRNLVGRSFLPVAKRDPLPKNQPWKNVVFAQLRNTWMARDARYKLVLRNEGSGPNELFDTTGDPGEKTNRYEDPQFNNVRTRLTKELEGWKKRAV